MFSLGILAPFLILQIFIVNVLLESHYLHKHFGIYCDVTVFKEFRQLIIIARGFAIIFFSEVLSSLE